MRKFPLTMASMLLFGFLLACNQSEPDGAAAIVDLALALDPDDEELRLMKDQLADSIARS
ncbi:hypothetical protein BCV73_05175 [Paenibacillus sp. SSG-1]|uniref:Uncharacterized protein n=1 Tax=Paenibacillus cineris TaxID=237530 RepID=A0ABQ4L8I3_9BACL|nr:MULTISPECIES: hypothetical protein [Paenibacillus]OXL82539.1 hypothetical protein BCV73_05175 [Paenibacillus sp. SSG-1]GIO52897.1 hypothetical protein J21TS7_12150 [Paenibacillus cineris]